MTVEDTIREYVKQLHTLGTREKIIILKMLLNFFKRHWSLESDIKLLRNNLDEFLQKTVDGIQSYRRDKNRLNNYINTTA